MYETRQFIQQIQNCNKAICDFLRKPNGRPRESMQRRRRQPPDSARNQGALEAENNQKTTTVKLARNTISTKGYLIFRNRKSTLLSVKQQDTL